tara:strand:- start:457 stop:777 length:321 start_codon:yes stop_codon:yes gene_type:complete
MDKLSNDLVELIMKKLSLNDILLFSITNKEYYKMLDDLFYLNLAIDIYGKEFWTKAFFRPTIKSKPLNSMKLELIRIERFQTRVYKSISRRWTNDDFYSFWSLDYF